MVCDNLICSAGVMFLRKKFMNMRMFYHESKQYFLNKKKRLPTSDEPHKIVVRFSFEFVDMNHKRQK